MSYNDFIDTVLKHSSDSWWPKAKLEWVFDYVYESENQSCICGQYPIKNVCVIYNTVNGNSLEVGNHCVKKFLKLNTGQMLLDNLKKLFMKPTKGIGKPAIEYMWEKKLITLWEFEFYINTAYKRNISEKQAKVRACINKKFLDFMMQRDSTREKVIQTFYFINEHGRHNYLDIWFMLVKFKNYRKLDWDDLIMLDEFIEENGIIFNKENKEVKENG